MATCRSRASGALQNKKQGGGDGKRPCSLLTPLDGWMDGLVTSTSRKCWGPGSPSNGFLGSVRPPIKLVGFRLPDRPPIDGL